MIFRDLTLAGPQCNASGLTLALGLWWQYAFSILVALTTYLSLRHPLSRLKRLIDSYPLPLVILVLAIGISQAVVWHLKHGYEGGHGFCFYGRPAELGSELMQFLPRLLTSLAITAIYIPLIGFLRRPDSGAAYLGTATGGRSREPTPNRSFDDGERGIGEEDIPPWEKLSFPTYTWDDKIKGIRVESAEGAGEKMGKRATRIFGGMSNSASMKTDISVGGNFQTFSSRHGLFSDSTQSSVHFDIPSSPQPAHLLHTFGQSPSPLATIQPSSGTRFTPPRPVRGARPSTAPATLAPHAPKPRALSRVRHGHTPSIVSISDLTPAPSEPISGDEPRVSFLNMIAYTPPTPDHSHRRTRSRSSTLVEMVEGKLGLQGSRSRSASPEVEEVAETNLETMASYMRRRTSYYLWCFPLTVSVI